MFELIICIGILAIFAWMFDQINGNLRRIANAAEAANKREGASH